MSTSPQPGSPGAEPGLSWRDAARCAEVDPDLFFPVSGANARPAKRVCSGCEVRAECLRHALDNHENDGVWGGTSERERRRMAAARRRQAKGLAA